MINSVSISNLPGVSENKRQSAPKAPSIRPSPAGHKAKDRVTLGNTSFESTTYRISRKTYMNGSDYDSLRELIVKILGKQGVATQIATGDAPIDLQNLTPDQAQELVAEDGYFGVPQTSDRIFQFSVSLTGNDPTKLQEIKASVTEGFHMAREALGGYLPEVSEKTYDTVMEKLDDWAAAAS